MSQKKPNKRFRRFISCSLLRRSEDCLVALRARRFERQMPRVTASAIYRDAGLTPLSHEEFERRFGHLPTS